ncbi:MAG: family 43 glycosylhydrolase [Lachnospiraceae bacterium]|nr:family 43 glycosylhydrolase [Lachnospiraceae bacterium]
MVRRKWLKSVTVGAIMATMIASSVYTGGITGMQAKKEAVRTVRAESGTILTGEKGKLIYSTDFGNAEEWSFIGGKGGEKTFSMENGMAKSTYGNGGKIVCDVKEAEDFVLETDVVLTEDESQPSKGQASILFRLGDIASGSEYGYDGYCFSLNADEDKVSLNKVSGDEVTVVATKRVSLAVNESYTVTIGAYKEHIVCAIDDNGTSFAKIDVKEDTYKKGFFGFCTNKSAAEFRSLTVTEYKENTTTTGKTDITYTNPLVGASADIEILYYEGTYYMYPTSPGTKRNGYGFKVYTSTDLVHWTDRGWALYRDDVDDVIDYNGNNTGKGGFWAPGVIEKDGRFYMYYTCKERVCLAVADSPLGPFYQDGDTGSGGFLKKEDLPSGVVSNNIDAHVFRDDDGQLYFYCVLFTGGNDIWGCRLGEDMVTIDQSSWTRLLHANQVWDQQDMYDNPGGSVNEGPFVVKYDGKYYLTYSGSDFRSAQYGIGYAVADSPLGAYEGRGSAAVAGGSTPSYEKYALNPVMQSNSLVKGAGHHCIVKSPDGSEYWVAYHCHNEITGSADPRSMCIDKMQFVKNKDGETVIEINGPTVTKQDGPSGAVDVDNLIDMYIPNGKRTKPLPTSVAEVTVPWGTTQNNTGITDKITGVTLVTSKEKSKTVEDDQTIEDDKKEIEERINLFYPASERQDKDYENLTLSIQWDFSKVNFKPDKTTTYDIEGTIVLPVVEKAYGQVKNLGNKNLKVTSKITVQARTTSAVQYNLNGGVNHKNNATTFTGKLTLNAPKKSGYLFVGWYREQTFKNKVTMLSGIGDFRVYAKWSKISLSKAVINSWKNQKGKKLSIKLKKDKNKPDGYRVLLATDKKFRKNVKKLKVASGKVSVTVKGLKKGKTYFIKAWAYRTDSCGREVNGAASKVVKVKITR